MKHECVKQQDSSDCGPAALATVMRHYGLKLNIAEIRQATGTDKQGTNIYGMIKGAERLGFDVKGVKGKKENFFLEMPLPCIAHVTKKGNMVHYVVIHKITKKKIIIADPSDGLIKLKPEEFFGEVNNSNGVPNYKWSGILIFLRPTVNIKKKSNGNNKINIFSLVYSQKKLLVNIFIASFMYTVLGIIGAFYFKLLVDDILPNSLSKTLTTVSVGAIILCVFKIIMDFIRSHLLMYLGQRMDIDLLGSYYDHVLELPEEFFETRTVGEIIARFNDASYIRDTISNATMILMLDSIMAIFGGLVLYFQSKMLFFIVLILIALYMIIALCFSKVYEKLNRKQMGNGADLTAYLVQSITGIQTIKIHNAEREAHLSTERKFVKVLKSMFKLFSIKNIQSALKNFVEFIGGIIILWVGGIYVINGKMTIGQLITFNSLLIYFLQPIRNIINLQPEIKTAKIAIERLGEIISLEVEKTDKELNKIKLDSVNGDIVFNNVKFRYGSRRLAVDDVSFTIPKGKCVAFIGESGSGKTTIAKLLLHLYNVEEGYITFGDIDINNIQIESLRDKIAYIQQETFIFSGSVYDNIVLGLDNISKEEVIEIAKMAKAHEFICEFPRQYDTIIGENGMGLSGGQKQRIAIARALIRKPEVLILDEATSNLDSITEKAITDMLTEYCKNRTTIFIAHRLSTIKNCELIFVFEKGKLCEIGTHSELICKKGKYAEYISKQTLD